MSDFDSRFTEDFAHELSDLTVAAEELLKAQEEEGVDPYGFAKDFRSLIATLEMSARLLQWEKFADFLADVALRLEMAVDGDMAVVELRQKAEKTNGLLLQVHEGFDGLPFSDEQIASWEQILNAIWLSKKGLVEISKEMMDETFSKNKPPHLPEEVPAVQKAVAAKGTPENTEALLVDSHGVQFVIPLQYVVAVSTLEKHLNQMGMDAKEYLQVYGRRYPFESVKPPFQVLRGRDGARFEGPEEIVAVRTKGGEKALVVDRVLGFERLSSESVTFEKSPNPDFCGRLQNSRMPCWVWDADRVLPVNGA